MLASTTGRRVGIGHDIHRLVAGRRLVLGGVEVAAAMGFDTPSDGDVLCHALIDALAAALVEGDRRAAVRARGAVGLSHGSPAVSPSARPGRLSGVICALTGRAHRLFWMRSAWWCHDCRQKIESCCEGGGCPSIAESA